MLVMAIVGCLTSFVAATIAVTQTDIKKVLAYSTISQLGYMFMALGVGAFAGGIFHLFTHAFFIALLFLGAGSVIRGMHHDQDISRMGGLREYLPTTYKCMLAAWLAIRGEFAWAPILLSGAVMFWVAGFDVIYSLQDTEFDRRAKLFSLPSKFGVAPALRISALFHGVTVVLLAATAMLTSSGWLAYAGVTTVAFILYWEHRIVKPHDLSRVNVAFFNLNGYVSILLLLTFAGDILIR